MVARTVFSEQADFGVGNRVIPDGPDGGPQTNALLGTASRPNRRSSRHRLAAQIRFDQLREFTALNFCHIIAWNFLNRNKAYWNEGALHLLSAMLAQVAIGTGSARHDQGVNFVNAKLIGHVEDRAVGDRGE